MAFYSQNVPARCAKINDVLLTGYYELYAGLILKIYKLVFS